MRTLSTIVLFLLLCFAASILNATTYYVNNVTGSNSNSGTSSASPWQDFTNINSRTFVAGDQILLARGSVWNQQMDLHGSGSSGAPIVLDAYGTGNDPRIQRNYSVNDRTILMYDPSNWIVRNLEICNAGDGIQVWFTTLFHENLTFDNLYIHNIDLVLNGSPTTFDGIWYSKGISLRGPDTILPTSSQWLCRNITITNCEIAYVSAALDFIHQDVNKFGNQYSFQNYRIKNCFFHDSKGPLGLSKMTNTKMISCRLSNLATSALPQGTTGIFQWVTSDLSYLNNLMQTIPNTGSADQCMIDLEGYNDITLVAGNYISETAGPGVEFLQLAAGASPPRDPATDHNTNSSVIGNTFVQNGGYALKVSNPNGNIPTGTLSSNLYHEPTSGFTTGNFGGFAQSNNLSIASLSSIYNASKDYSGTQGTNGWSYQLYNGSSYSNLSYDSVNEWWGTSTGRISQFDTFPNATSSNWLARTWTAPTAGTVAIRGRVLKNDVGGGDGITARVTKNGAIIWPTSGTPQTIGATDDSGVDTNLDGITVAANDVIRFEVNNGGAGNSTNDLTSWSPTIAYTVGGLTNLAPSATLSVDSTNTTYTKDKAVDGIKDSNTSRWISTNTAEPHWFQLDWASNKTISNVKVWSGTMTGAGWQIYSYKMQSWNGSVWVDIAGASVTNNPQDGYSGQFNDLTFTAVTTSKIRMYITDGVNQTGYTDARLLEIEIWGTDPSSSTNLAPTATLSVDSTNTTYTKDKAVDGIKDSNTSRWISTNTAEPHWFQLDWASNKTISNVKVWSGTMTGAGWQIYSYKMQSWNGSVWVDIAGASVTNNPQDGYSGQFNDLTFTAVTTSKIRMYITDGVNQTGYTDARLLEIEIWGN